MNDCYQEVTLLSNIALPPDLDDILDLGASMEGESSTIDSCLQGRKREQQCIEEQWQMEQKHQTWQCSQRTKTRQVQEHVQTQHQCLPEMVHNDLEKWKEPYKQNLLPSQMEQMKPQHLGASMEGGSSTIDSCFQERRTVPQIIEPQWHMAHNLQAWQYSHTGKAPQVQDDWWTHQQQPQDMAHNDNEQWMKPHQHNQQHPQMELTELQHQMQQPNLQSLLVEQMREWVCLLEQQV